MNLELIKEYYKTSEILKKSIAECFKKSKFADSIFIHESIGVYPEHDWHINYDYKQSLIKISLLHNNSQVDIEFHVMEYFVIDDVALILFSTFGVDIVNAIILNPKKELK